MENFKYRIWNKIEDIMYYPNNLDLEKWLVDMDGNLGYLNLSDMSWSGVIPKDFYEILPYTGINEYLEQGKPIYEGDLVHIYPDYEVEVYEVARREDRWVLIDRTCEQQDGRIEYMFDYNGIQRPLRVIGNIYENPELIKYHHVNKIGVIYNDDYTRKLAIKFVEEKIRENHNEIEIRNKKVSGKSIDIETNKNKYYIRSTEEISRACKLDEVYICGYVENDLFNILKMCIIKNNSLGEPKFICEHCREEFDKDKMINCHDEYICKDCYKEWCMWG